ncbi:hypothetical protein NGTWS0302_07550 [Mycolicibacterium cyprinidarum]|uniref:Ryanodine receptor Ryr domain-containing protein n=1 Tax=Mycolicibacterium cyprinidarum TaxID=2860311 RepID=A0ABQ4V6K9_9MYCO|nr:hypothetical protein NGTWS1702_35770 [Mycolicibacterium sp. NGTWSNA01]GJF12724.1 hypothetical protein NGTWS1803_23040 [Mycolicibacterium sp. NGTWS1803]GJF14778.1 hypothetical protein NGTWS0302_07550 [Mycolicibacterium sp. NGTWS0302]
MRSVSGIVRNASLAATVVLIAYLALLALQPDLRQRLPPALRWFGQPGSETTIAIVTVVLMLTGALVFHRHRVRQGAAPVAVVAGLAMISLTLGLASYWNCHDETHPQFFTTLMWTAGVVKGGTGSNSLDSGVCPLSPPVALEVARLSALAAVFLSVLGVAMALFQSRLDRLRVFFARSASVVVGLDDDTEPMLTAIAQTLERNSTLVVITGTPDHPCVQRARLQGARIVTVDFTEPTSLTSLSVWGKLERLYLLSPDPSTNLERLAVITERLNDVGTRQRLPLIVRIDDPWQAGAWRAQHFGGSGTRWAADAVGKYEVTARRLIDRITADAAVTRILVCGTSQLTLAICAEMSQRRLEHDYYSAPGSPQPPTLVLVAENADEYKRDHEYSCVQLNLPADHLAIEAIEAKPTVPTLAALIAGDDATGASVAAVLVDGYPGVEVSTGTRLAARFPQTAIYAWDANAAATEDRVALVGKLRTYRLSMDLPGGQAQDAWERAARLIHDRYAAESGHRTAATLPWAELDEFYRGSNRRQVENALWMVEKIGGHTWNTWGSPATPPTPMRGLDPLEQLRLLGFDRDAAMAMARAEHEDWCRYYRKAGWTFGVPRDDARKMHDNLVDWPAIETDPDRLKKALTSFATTLIKLRELGYRSSPIVGTSSGAVDSTLWKSFIRTGTVVAEQRDEPWTWSTGSGHSMRGAAGDWSVCDDEGTAWSVRDDIFRGRHEHVSGKRWRRLGTVMARPARVGETIETLEGSVVAADGDWVVKGEDGEQWPVPADDFARRYRRAERA